MVSIETTRHTEKMSEQATHHRRSCIATQRSDRGYSGKVQQMVRQLEMEGGMGGEGREGKRERHEPKNWRQVSQKELERMGPVARSRYLAYEAPSKDLQERQQESMRRVRERKIQQQTQRDGRSLTQLVEQEKNRELVGQIKSAEARQRIQLLCDYYQQEEKFEWNSRDSPTETRLTDRYRSLSFVTPANFPHAVTVRRMANDEMELRSLIDSQPTAVEAVRLKTFLKPHPQSHTHHDPLTQVQRKRCEMLIEDEKA